MQCDATQILHYLGLQVVTLTVVVSPGGQDAWDRCWERLELPHRKLHGVLGGHAVEQTNNQVCSVGDSDYFSAFCTEC